MNPIVCLIAAAGLVVGAAPAMAQKAATPVASASLDPKIKFKDGERYLSDLSSALEMPREQVCKELGQYDCFKDAFRIVLGGVDAENMAVNVPLETEALTAPIALDRVALHVCINRVAADMADPKHAVLYKGVSKGKPSTGWMRQTAGGLYDRLLGRRASAFETAQLVAFYDEVATSNGKPNPTATRDWVTLGCFAVASSTENVFY